MTLINAQNWAVLRVGLDEWLVCSQLIEAHRSTPLECIADPRRQGDFEVNFLGFQINHHAVDQQLHQADRVRVVTPIEVLSELLNVLGDQSRQSIRVEGSGGVDSVSLSLTLL
jgi:hypothetical protein